MFAAPAPIAEAARRFDVPAGDARVTLRLFAEQSGEQIVYLIDAVQGHRTRAVRGRLAAPRALEHMLTGTGLLMRRDPASGAMTVVRATENETATAPPPPPRALPWRSRSYDEDEVIALSAFTVSVQGADRYRAADAVSAVRVRAPLINTPSSISVITRDTIDDLVPTRLFDLTRYVAGIEEGRGIQFLDRQIIRGFESNGRTVDNFIQTGADNYEEALVERIEVFKGPNAILSPAGVPGGSINVITKSPSFRPRRTLTALAGRFDAQKLTLDATGPIEGTALAYRVVGVWQDTRRYWGNDVRLRRKALAPMLTWRLSDRTMLTTKLIATELWSFREPALILDPSVTLETKKPFLAPGFSSRSRNGIQPWSHVGTETLDAYALLTSELTDSIHVRLALNGRRYFEDSTQVFLQTPSLINRYNPYTGVLTQDQVWSLDPGSGTYQPTPSPLFVPTAIPVRGDTQETTLHSFTLQNDLVAEHRTTHFSLQTVAGWAVLVSNQTGRLRNGVLPPINLYAPLDHLTPQWESSLYANHRTKQRNWQIYLNQRAGLWRDRLLLTAGLMHYDVDTSFRNAVGPMSPLNILRDSHQMWLAGALLKPRENISVYYSYSTNSTPTVVNDIPLWRDGQQHEIGVKTEWFAQRLAVNIAWFDITQTNVSVPNPERQTNLNAPEHLLANLGDHGVEFELTGGLTENLSLIAAHTELRMRDRLGRRVRAVADRNSALLLNYRFREGSLANLSLHLGVTYAGKRAGDTTPVDFTPLGVITRQSFMIPAHTIVNFGASYRWGNYQLRINVDNLLDDEGYLQQAGGRVSGTGLSTAPGRNIKVALTVRF